MFRVASPARNAFEAAYSLLIRKAVPSCAPIRPNGKPRSRFGSYLYLRLRAVEWLPISTQRAGQILTPKLPNDCLNLTNQDRKEKKMLDTFLRIAIPISAVILGCILIMLSPDRSSQVNSASLFYYRRSQSSCENSRRKVQKVVANSTATTICKVVSEKTHPFELSMWQDFVIISFYSLQNQ